jgi:acetyl-CoA carboxylase carboxyl transferase subunit alpha
MKITAQDLLRFGIIDGVVGEPVGGAHRDPSAAIGAAGDAMDKALAQFASLPPDAVRTAREEKFLAIGRKV